MYPCLFETTQMERLWLLRCNTMMCFPLLAILCARQLSRWNCCVLRRIGARMLDEVEATVPISDDYGVVLRVRFQTLCSVCIVR